MSAASTPAPRAKSSSDARPSGTRHTLFLPMLILILGSGALATYQVMSMEEQLDQMTQAIDKYDGRVKIAIYEKTKFYTMARAVLSLAPKDPNANSVATAFNLRQLQEDQPDLMNANDPSDIAAANTNSAPEDTSSTNAAPLPSTNAAPAKAVPAGN